MLSSSTGANC